MLQTLIAGDTLQFEKSVPDYPASAGYTLKYRLVPRTGAGTAIVVTASASGADYVVNELPATTATWAPGFYSWSSWVEKASERRTLESGQIEIKPDPATTGAPLDSRSHARKVLDAIEAVLEGRASVDQQEVTLAGRSLKLTPIADLLALHDKYVAMVRREDDAARVAAGLPSRNRVLTRFSR